MKKIWIIPPVPKENKKIRVAAYCRVSTFGLNQLHSLDIQIEAYIKITKIGDLPVCFMMSEADCVEKKELNWIKCLRKLKKLK